MNRIEENTKKISISGTYEEFEKMRKNMIRISYVLESLVKVSDEKTRKEAQKNLDDFNEIYLTLFG